jgi:transposase-like protein
VITGVGRRRRWTDEEKARIVAESLDPAPRPVMHQHSPRATQRAQ